MKRIIGWGIVILVVIGIGSCAYNLVGMFGSLKEMGDKAAVAVAGVLPQLAANWKVADIEPTLTTDYVNRLKAADDPFANYRILGPLLEPTPCTTVRTNNNNGLVSAVVQCPETFANGKATVAFALVLTPTGWLINGIDVSLN
jgi:hypothetical protein